MANLYGPRIVTNGLVLCLDAGNTKSYPGSGTVWTDLSGNNYNSTLTNGPTYNSANKGSIVFDGTNDLAQTTYTNFNIQNKTLAAWVKLNSVSQQGGGLISIETQTSGPSFDGIVYNETNQGWGFGSDFYRRTAWSGVKETSTSAWVYMCATYTNNNYRLYRNGVQILNTTNYTVFNFNQNSRIRTGVRILYQGVEYGFLSSNIAQASVYNRALSNNEILINYNALKARFGL